MNRSVAILILLLLVATALLMGGAAYTVFETEQVIITRFGRIEGKAKTEPGFYLKLPFIDQAVVYDKRWLEWDGDPNQVPTKDKKYVWVDAYARWRITDPVQFYKRLTDEMRAQSRLDDIIDGEIRNVIANHNLIDIVRTSKRAFERADEYAGEEIDESKFLPAKGREKLTRLVLDKASLIVPDYGIELADVQFKRVNYIEQVQTKVFDRMISERKRIAQRFRSEGQGKAAEINGKIEREQKTIESEAYRQAEEIKGKADAEATAIYADAYNKDRKLYEFLKTMEAYRSFVDKDTSVVLSTEAQLLKLFRSKE